MQGTPSIGLFSWDFLGLFGTEQDESGRLGTNLDATCKETKLYFRKSNLKHNVHRSHGNRQQLIRDTRRHQ
jgi:hypothetical protein